MTRNKFPFVFFEHKDGKFLGFLSIDATLSDDNNPEVLTRKASKIYEQSILKIRCILDEIQSTKANRKPIPARMIWDIGDVIFHMKEDLEKLSLQLDGLYAHLVRDLGVKQKWLEKVVILRRYLPDKAMLPDSLSWGHCEKGTRKVAERVSRGLPPK